MTLEEAYEKRRQECLTLQRQLKKAEKPSRNCLRAHMLIKKKRNISVPSIGSPRKYNTLRISLSDLRDGIPNSQTMPHLKATK